MKKKPKELVKQKQEEKQSRIKPTSDDHDPTWHRNNLEEIDNLDNEIKQLERKMGLKTDVKRKKRFNDSIDREGLGLGFMSFLDDIETKAKL